jgi:hypothetical protein
MWGRQQDGDGGTTLRVTRELKINGCCPQPHYFWRAHLSLLSLPTSHSPTRLCEVIRYHFTGWAIFN